MKLTNKLHRKHWCFALLVAGMVTPALADNGYTLTTLATFNSTNGANPGLA